MNDTTIPVQVASNYRCREHNECSVTWKGTGCPRCAGNRERRQPTKLRYDTEQGRYR